MAWIVLFVDGDILSNIFLFGLWISLFSFNIRVMLKVVLIYRYLTCKKSFTLNESV